MQNKVKDYEIKLEKIRTKKWKHDRERRHQVMRQQRARKSLLKSWK